MKTISKFLAISVMTMFISCSSDDDAPQVINEEEVITTVRLLVTEDGTTNTQTVTWKEGVNGANNLPNVTLEESKTYSVKVQFLNESDPNDVEDITEEVIEERDEHYVFFDNSAVNGVTIASGNEDSIDSNNIGINIDTDWTVTAGSTGRNLRVYLIHEPTQKTGSTRADFGGETDVEVDFNVTIQ
ncbi:type 1 periplasmic binding fold superfamily protein [Aquimarina rhabdastrellae]